MLVPSVAMPRGPRILSSWTEVHWPGWHVLAFGSQSRPPLSPTYMFGPMKTMLKIGLCRVVLAMKSTDGADAHAGAVPMPVPRPAAHNGLLTRATSVGAVVLRFRNPT